MSDDARKVVETYFNAWKNNDFATMRSVLDDKVGFAGPIDRFNNADAYQKAIQGLSQIKTDIVTRKTFVDGPRRAHLVRPAHEDRARRAVEPCGERQDHDGARRVRRSPVQSAFRTMSDR